MQGDRLGTDVRYHLQTLGTEAETHEEPAEAFPSGGFAGARNKGPHVAASRREAVFDERSNLGQPCKGIP